MLGQLNGVFRGMFSRESWTLSQAYYFGRITANPSHRAEVVDGTPWTCWTNSDKICQGKPESASGAARTGGQSRPGPFDEAALLKEIATGAAYHGSWCA